MLVSLHNSISQIKQIIPHKNLVAITTRANPTKETFKIPINRRPGATNKRTLQMDSNPTKSAISVAIQTDTISNKGKGLDPLDPSKHEALFTAYDETPTPCTEKISTEYLMKSS